MRPVRLMTVEPGHATAARLLQAATPGVHPRVYVYAELGPDLFDLLRAVDAANRRADRPTAWELDVRTGPSPRARCYREQPGNTVVVAGANRAKLDLAAGAVAENLHVLVDPPFVLDPADLPRLEAVLKEAEWREVLVKELAPARHSPLNALQRDLMRDPQVFGGAAVGSAARPGLTLETTHGPPARSDTSPCGDCLADAAAPLVDLAFWLLVPDQAIDPHADVELLDAVSWPTPVARPPSSVNGAGHALHYGNGHATFTVRGVHVRVGTLWEAPAGGDWAETWADAAAGGVAYECVARGGRSRVAVRRGPAGDAELTVAANDPAGHAPLRAALARRAGDWQSRHPGLHFEDRGTSFRLTGPGGGPEEGHGGPLARVLAEYVEQFRHPRSVPAWERPNLLAKYRLTTAAAHAARLKVSGPG